MTRLTLPIALRRPASALALAAACAAPALAAPSPAEEAAPAATPPAIRPLAGVLITGTAGSNNSGFTNPDGSTVTGNLSGRYEVLAGAEFPIDPNGLSLRLTAGIHVTGNLSGSGGREHLTRLPLEATLWYPLNDKLRIGGGARYSMHARIE